MNKPEEDIISIFRRENCSCVIANEEGLITIGRERGVKDLMYFLKNKPEVFKGGFVADKVVGKGAAALMVLGGIKSVYADIMSRNALELLARSGVKAEYGVLTNHIINRAGTDMCPVEKICLNCKTAEECLPLIEEFISKIR